MPRFHHAASIHPTREALHDSLAQAHFGHLDLDDMIAVNAKGFVGDLAIVREGLEAAVKAYSEDAEDRELIEATAVLEALDPRLFQSSFEKLFIQRLAAEDDRRWPMQFVGTTTFTLRTRIYGTETFRIFDDGHPTENGFVFDQDNTRLQEGGGWYRGNSIEGDPLSATPETLEVTVRHWHHQRMNARRRSRRWQREYEAHVARGLAA